MSLLTASASDRHDGPVVLTTVDTAQDEKTLEVLRSLGYTGGGS